MRIGDMNWMQVEEYLTVDCILPERVAADAAEPLGVPVFPVVPYGVTPYFREFPGTISLRVETHLRLVGDILDGMAHSGLTNASIADALAMPRYRGLYVALGREVLAVAAAQGVEPEAFDGFDPSAYLATAPGGAAKRSLDALVAHNRRSAKSHSGIWRDLAVRKRPTEVDAQLGIVVALIHEIAGGARQQSLGALEALAATPHTITS